MTTSVGKKVPESVRARLLNLAREQGIDFQLLLTRYGLERLLYRLSQSAYRDRFILKGAMLFVLWSDNPHRATRDIDFLGSGDSSEDGLLEAFREISAIEIEDDGVVFDPRSVRVEPIRDDTEYGGSRITLTGELAGARIPVQADVGFGDAVTPEAVETIYPTLLGGAAPSLWTYPRETVIAEKYQALVALGMANSRMKDYFDLWVMARSFNFEGSVLAAAIRNTFGRRRTELPQNAPLGLLPAFFEDGQKAAQWRAFLTKMDMPVGEVGLNDVCEVLWRFFEPPTRAAAGRDEEFNAIWPLGGPWESVE